MGFWFCTASGDPAPAAPSPTRPPGGHTAGSELERQHAALVKVQLVLLRLADVQDLDVAAFHAHGQPVLVGAVAQGKNLGATREEVRSRSPRVGGGRPEGGVGGRREVQGSPAAPPGPPRGEAAGPGPGSSRRLHVKSLILISITQKPFRGLTSIICSERTTALGGRAEGGGAAGGQWLPLSRRWEGSRGPCLAQGHGAARPLVREGPGLPAPSLEFPHVPTCLCTFI